MHDNVAQSFDTAQHVLATISHPIADAIEAVHFLALAGHATPRVVAARAALESALEAITGELDTLPVPYAVIEGAAC